MSSTGRVRQAVIGVATIAALAFLPACSDDSATSIGDARSELRAAIDSALAADSMHIEISSGAEDDSSWRTSIDINAPDRIRSVSTTDGSESSESIVIGDTIYFSDVERPHYFTSFEQPDTQSPAGDLMALLEAIRDSDDVQVDGDAFVVRLGSEPFMSVTLRIDEGYLVSLRLPAGADQESLEALYVFSEFGSAPEVVAPSPGRVTEAPITPECPDDGELPEGALVCTGGNLEEPQDVDLPRPPEPVESTLQFRPVRGDTGSGCAPRETNPRAGDAVTMRDTEGVCLDLAEAALDVTRVESIQATSMDGEQVALDITLLPADAQRFDIVAEGNLGQPLALVILGRVVSAPIIQATEFEGRLQINGLSLNQAARVSAALTS